MDYVVVVQAPAYALSPSTFATESAFAEHLRELRKSVGLHFSRLVLIAPQLSDAAYEATKHHLDTLDLTRDEVLFLPAYPETASARGFWFKHARPLWRRLNEAIENAAIVHSGMSTDLWRPLMAMANLAAWRADRRVIFVVDIDFRMHTTRLYRLGFWSYKSYLVNRWIHDPFKWLQVWLAPRMFQLVLLKSASMVRDFGRGQTHVRNFYDTVHADEHILTDDQVQQRLQWIRDQSRPLRLCYFGRLAANKGLDRMIEAVRLVREQGCEVRLTIIGDGPCGNDLRQQATKAGLDKQVIFLPQVAYGKPLFGYLGEMHLTIAAPLIEDTPRAAFDSMARGLPVLAFDISYFRDLADASGAVILATWPHASALAEQIVSLSRNREHLAEMALRGLAFARDNTQQAWLDRRAQWMRHFGLREPPPPSESQTDTTKPADVNPSTPPMG